MPRSVRLQLRKTLPELGRTVLREAAKGPAVIFAPAAFAALGDDPAAVHVRLTAPLATRIAAYARDEVVDLRCAERAVRHDDAQKRAWVRTMYRLDPEDPTLFALVADTSRFSRDRLVEILLAAAPIAAV
jgi:cytidylate kinase